MRVDATPRSLDVEPGDSAAVTVEVVNTSDIIDGVSAHVHGLPGHCVRSTPQRLPLFPDSAGRVSLDLAVPRTHPAGRHPLTVQVVSHATGSDLNFVDLELEVAARPSWRMEAQPRLIRARRGARFVIELTNTGNVALDVRLEGRDADRAVRTTFSPERRQLPPGATAAVLLAVRGPRMFTGAETDRTVTVVGIAEPVRTSVDEAAGEEYELVRETVVQLRQRPLIGRGLLTAAILVAIVATWAAIFLFGLAKVFAQDPMTKQAPASFFASLNEPASTSSGPELKRALTVSTAAGTAPAGALSKNGQLPPGMGGQITGTVRSANDGQPVGRILVQAYRVGRSGLVAMSSAASQADGTYALAGLFPTSYYLSFSASGYRTQWYPNAPTYQRAARITAVAQGSVPGIDVAIVGFPASISGRVDPGDTLKPVPTKVAARALRGARTGQVLATATTSSSGAYTLARLPAPGSYQLTFTTPGYLSSTLVDTVAGGDKRLEPTVTIAAGGGQISGVVLAGATPLGGATVSTTVAGRPLRITTPTTGQVGAFVLDNLPTPGTYVVTVSKAGNGSATRIVDLAAGQTQQRVDLVLGSGSGSITGVVESTDGRRLGGATVSVGGTSTGGAGLPTVTTLTAGDPGAFAIAGLRAPASYTLTVTLDGYESTSVPVTLPATGPASVTVRLRSRLGAVTGIVSAPDGTPLAGATVTATNGRTTRATTTNTSDGGYLFGALEPGSYSVTVTAPGRRQRTALVTIVPGGTARQNFELVT